MSFGIGDQVGDYRIVGAVGSGGTGRVFRVEHAITGRVEAMKVLLETRTGSAAPAERFQREIKLQAKLDHPGIASVHNAFWVNDELVMIMELVEGGSLNQLVAAGPVSIASQLRIAVQSLEALDYAHEQGVTHRDVKPENIMVTPDGRVKLMDFGLAKQNKDPKLTQMGSVMGSVFYISPEQARGSVDTDRRTDIYSFGCVLYELVTGRKPFLYDNTYALLQASVHEAPKPPIELRPDIPLGLNNAILRAMAKDPEARFQTADEFRHALHRVARDPSAVVAPPKHDPALADHAVTPALRAQRRRRMIFVAAGLVTVVYLGLQFLSRVPSDESSRMAEVEAASVGPDLGGYRALQTISLGQGASQIAFSSDGRRVVVSDARAVELFDVFSGASLGASQPLASEAADVQISPNGKWAAAALGEEALLWQMPAFQTPRRLRHAGGVTAIAFSGDSRYLGSGAADRTLRVWNLQTPGLSEVFPGPEEGPRSLVFSPTAPLLASIDDHGTVRFEPLKQGGSEELEGDLPHPRHMRFSSSGLEFAAYGDQDVVVWDIPSREIVLRAHWPGTILAVERSVSEGWVALVRPADNSNVAELRELAADESLLQVQHSSEVVAGAFALEGREFATATQGGTLTIWQLTRP